ncbi:MAG: glutathione synthase [Rhodocyclaceae bacterium]|nr:glutathione synthase [Rhodocyclaceae bacterium]MBK6906046.1 glutathione synthase [Rhodocyclaceae bacterium]
MELAFIIDPPEKLAAYKDSSVAMMRSAAARGHHLWIIERASLLWQDGGRGFAEHRSAPDAGTRLCKAESGVATVFARARRIAVSESNSLWFSVLEEAVRPLRDYSAVLMRQDPPFDMEYVAATWLLQRAEAEGARIFNRPQAIRDHSEKLALCEFAEFAPTTRVARTAADVQAFIDEFKDVVIKPLDGMGGAGVFRIRHDEPNRNVIVETVTALGSRSVMVQRYLPEVTAGDKRVLIIGGQVVPWGLARIPQGGELRGNLAAGGKGVAQPLTPRERQIADCLAPTLWARGLFIVGLDMIGERLTEINVTSPTCFVEISQHSGIDVAGLAIAALEKECTG